MDGNAVWCSYIKDYFSRKSWLDNLPDKEALTIAGMFKKWLRNNKRGSVYKV
jgi:hypothetical protein